MTEYCPDGCAIVHTHKMQPIDTTVTTERMKRAEARLDEALSAGETPFKLATIVTACWRYSIGDDDGAAYGLTEHGLELWQLIERVIKFERSIPASPSFSQDSR